MDAPARRLRCENHHFTWYDGDYRVKWDSARQLCTDVATKRTVFAGQETGLSTQCFRHLENAIA
eukprot:6062106-Amphidinium_carterae.1